MSGGPAAAVPTDEAPVVRVRDLVFIYPGRLALDRASFTIRRGAITALVGPNGAGKTTLMRCLAGLDPPFSGAIEVAGVDVLAQPRRARQRLGFLQDLFGLYDGLTVRRCLIHFASIQRVPPEERDGRVLWAARSVGITDRLDQRAGTLSRGLRQRLAIAQTIIHRPPLLLLDEPASGLDPEARADLSALLRALRDDGMTLLVSSHILAELEDYSTEMLVLRDGRIVDHRPLGGVQPGVRLRIELAHPVPDAAQRMAGLGGLAGIAASPDGRVVQALFAGDAAARHDLLVRLLAAGLPVASFEAVPERLQDLYMATVGNAGGFDGTAARPGGRP